ncbi:MAG: FHA domain-containing protein [Kofleriaceae bacterium]
MSGRTRSASSTARQLAVGTRERSAVVAPRAHRPQEVRTPSVLGRDRATADVVIDDESVSQRHAELYLDTVDRWWIRDLGSSNGTFVDGVRVTEPRVLDESHEIQLGSVRLSFRAEPVLRVVFQQGNRSGRVQRGAASVELDEAELAFVLELASARHADAERPDGVRGFVRSIDMARFVSSDDSVSAVRQLARRVERKLVALGEPAVMESCDRRGYRLCARTTLTVL